MKAWIRNSSAPELLGLFIILLLISLPLLYWHPTLIIDDLQLLAPLRDMHGLHDYVRAWQENLIIDIQPVRDLSYWIELQLETYIGRNSQLVNLALWWACLTLFSKTLFLNGIEKRIRWVLVLLVGLHPVMTNSVFWISGRKHLLSALFVMLSLYFLSRWRKQKADRWLWCAGLTYLLALFSHPINVGLPIFLFFWLCSEKSQSKAVFLISVSAIAGAVALINASYYASDSYMLHGGMFSPKFRAESWHDLEARALLLGRYVFQLLLPFRPSTLPYNLYSLPSRIGLFVALTSTVIFARGKIKTPAWPWILFAALPIAVVTVKVTGQGGNDTYLLTPLLGIGLFLGTRVRTLSKTALAAFAVVLICYAGIDGKMADVWSSEEKVLHYNHESEQGTISKITLARYLINNRKDLNLASEIVFDLMKNSPRVPDLGFLLGKLIYSQPMPSAKKAELFLRHAKDDPWYAYYWAVFESDHGQHLQAHERILSAWNKNPSFFYVSFREDISAFEKKWTRICELAGRNDCLGIRELISSQEKIRERAGR